MRGLIPLLILALSGPGLAAAQQQDAVPPQPSVADVRPRSAFTAGPVPAAERAPAPYDAPSGNILFRMNIAGRDVWGVLDSGAESSMVDLALARQAGLSVTATPQTLLATGGSLPVWRAENVAMTVPGQIQVTHSVVPAVDLSALSKAHQRDVGFIAGQDWLKAMVLIVDPVQRVFLLGPSGGAPNIPGAQVLALETDLPPRIGVSIAGRQTRVTIDTGYNGQMTLTSRAWTTIVSADARVGSVTSVGIDGNRREERATVLPEVALGNLKVSDVQVKESERWDDWGDGSIGLGYLSHARFILDLGQKTITLSPILASPAP